MRVGHFVLVDYLLVGKYPAMRSTQSSSGSRKGGIGWASKRCQKKLLQSSNLVTLVKEEM